MTFKLSKKDFLKMEKLSYQYLGEVRVESATRKVAIVRVRGELWEFIVNEKYGLQLKHAPPLSQIRQLAFLKAKNAIHIVRAGHKNAVDRKNAKKALDEKNKPKPLQKNFLFNSREQNY